MVINATTEGEIWKSSLTWVTKGSSSLSTASVRISRLLGSHLKLMFAVLMLVMFLRREKSDPWIKRGGETETNKWPGAVSFIK